MRPAPGAPGSALGFAAVNSNGSLYPAPNSENVDRATKVDFGSPVTGVYCLHTTFTPANVVATIYGAGSEGGEIQATTVTNINCATGDYVAVNSPGIRPGAVLASRSVPPLISREEALRLGELTDRAEIEALVERAWRVRLERFGDSTDMCSLVNAKSGGCAEDCGFCSQSRFAEADTPMHAMMDPDQILEHARAAEAAGAHRFCMVTQGQGLSKRDFEKILAGARLVAEHTNLKRCVSIGHMSTSRAHALKDAGIQRVHHNVETAESYYPEVSSTVRYEGRLRTIDAVRDAGLETCVGGILNLGESNEQRVEMAFQLAEVNPTSVPINLLNPRPGTKFGDRDLMDPLEAVKWVAIFRLIIPGALFRLCGGRNENLGHGELQQLAVKAGLNGVMMGNFLTTLGSEPEQDREMFEELGLNVARQTDNGANPRPDNRSGWLEGQTPRTPVDELIDSQEDANFWNPATQLRHRKKSSVPPRPDGAPNTYPEVIHVEPAA